MLRPPYVEVQRPMGSERRVLLLQRGREPRAPAQARAPAFWSGSCSGQGGPSGPPNPGPASSLAWPMASSWLVSMRAALEPNGIQGNGRDVGPWDCRARVHLAFTQRQLNPRHRTPSITLPSAHRFPQPKPSRAHTISRYRSSVAATASALPARLTRGHPSAQTRCPRGSSPFCPPWPWATHRSSSSPRSQTGRWSATYL